MFELPGMIIHTFIEGEGGKGVCDGRRASGSWQEESQVVIKINTNMRRGEETQVYRRDGIQCDAEITAGEDVQTGRHTHEF